MTTANALLNDRGEYDAYAWPGGYPIYYVTKDAGVLCPACANENKSLTHDPYDAQWYIVSSDVNWEDSSLSCDHCSKPIESAYGGERGGVLACDSSNVGVKSMVDYTSYHC